MYTKFNLPCSNFFFTLGDGLKLETMLEPGIKSYACKIKQSYVKHNICLIFTNNV